MDIDFGLSDHVSDFGRSRESEVGGKKTRRTEAPRSSPFLFAFAPTSPWRHHRRHVVGVRLFLAAKNDSDCELS